MANDLITPGRKLGYSNLYLDFLNGSDSARRFFPSSDIQQIASLLDASSYNREAISTILERQNRQFGASDATLGNISVIGEKNALCVFSGQQAGLFGGPMLVIFKALGIIKQAKLYAEQLNRPVVPIFWIAGDDHDFEEVNHTYLLSREGKIVSVAYETTPERALPVSQIELSDTNALESAISLLEDTLGHTDFSDELYALLRQSYRPEETMVSAFGKMMTHLLGRYGLVLFNPDDAEAKTLAAPLFKMIVKKQDDISERLSTANREIVTAGYHLQVEKSEDAVYLFYNNGGRRPITRDGDSFVAGDERFSESELMSLIDKYPERFSPDVFTRPLLQSYLFPTLAQAGGPSEIAYLAQGNAIFEAVDLFPPVQIARVTATLLETRLEKLITSLGITFDDLTGDIEQTINSVLAKSFPADLESDVKSIHRSVKQQFAELIDQSLDFDSSLKGFAEQTQGKIDYQLKAFESKLFSLHKKKSQETRDRIYRLQNALFPNRGLQERTHNITLFLSRYGPDLIGFVHDRLDCCQKAHQIIHLSEMRS